MTTSKTKFEGTTINHHERISSSKRTMINNTVDQLVDNNTIGKSHHHSTRSSKLKHNYQISKPESGSEEIYTTPLNNEGIKISSSITQKQRVKQREGIGDYINEDADEESTAIRAIMTKTKTPTERVHRLLTSSNNSAIHLQQQDMGDHYSSNTKQHKNRSKTNGKYHQELDEGNIYRWRLFMYILTITILAFVIYRFLLAIWPKPKKTFMEKLIDDLSNFFTP